MSYPFLPVNPCCTDVVLNSPCGCTSTLPNTGCGQNPCETNVTLSSNVLYNGPALDCIIAEPCDTLNVILQKIDEIICNLLTQINTLNLQVGSINNQVMQINNNIITINNTLDVCCNATTTTTTTFPCDCTIHRLVGPSVNPGNVTYVPCGSSEVITKTATDVVELVCVDNTYGVIRIGNVSFINLLTCCEGPTTTTTTTAAPLCTCIEIVIDADDIARATGNLDTDLNNVVFLNSPSNGVILCDGGTIKTSFTEEDAYKYCIKSSAFPLLQLYYYKDNFIVSEPDLESYLVNMMADCSLNGDCIEPTTTTTTTTV